MRFDTSGAGDNITTPAPLAFTAELNAAGTADNLQTRARYDVSSAARKSYTTLKDGLKIAGKLDKKWEIFRLSDLELFDAFPLFVLRRGIEIELTLSKKYANMSYKASLAGAPVYDADFADSEYTLTNPEYHSHLVLPTASHLGQMKDLVASGDARILMTPIEGKILDGITQSNSYDVSTKYSLFKEGFITFVAKDQSPNKPFAAKSFVPINGDTGVQDGQSLGGARTTGDLSNLKYRVGGEVFPGSSAFDDADVV